MLKIGKLISDMEISEKLFKNFIENLSNDLIHGKIIGFQARVNKSSNCIIEIVVWRNDGSQFNITIDKYKVY